MARNLLRVRSPDVDRRRTSFVSVASSRSTFIQSASFGSTNIDAYYLILAWKAHEHIDFNVDANEHHNGSSWPSQCWSPSLSGECYALLSDAVNNDTVHSLISQLVQALSGGTSQWKREASYSSGRALLR